MYSFFQSLDQQEIFLDEQVQLNMNYYFEHLYHLLVLILIILKLKVKNNYFTFLIYCLQLAYITKETKLPTRVTKNQACTLQNQVINRGRPTPAYDLSSNELKFILSEIFGPDRFRVYPKGSTLYLKQDDIWDLGGGGYLCERS